MEKSPPRMQNCETTSSPAVFTDGRNCSVQQESSVANVSYDQAPGIGPDETEYRMDYNNRGKVLVFNHKKFDSPEQEERVGTELDKKEVVSTFEQIGFDVDAYEDLISQDLQTKVTAVAGDVNHGSCLVVVIMTHGEAGGMLHARDQTYNIDVILSCFFANRCPALAGKPKLFIVQACRGESLSEACMVRYDTKLASTTRFYSIPAEADILLAFSTYAGCKSHREGSRGSWFIQEVCKELKENASKLDMISMLTNVTRHVAIKKQYLDGKQIPVIQSTLTRKLMLYAPPLSKMVQHAPVTGPQETVRHDSIITKSYNTGQEATPEPVSTTKNEHPETDVVLKLQNGLHLFLQKKRLELIPMIYDSGEEILLWLSRWNILDHTLKCHTYKKLRDYLQSYAKDWECYNLLYIPSS